MPPHITRAEHSEDEPRPGRLTELAAVAVAALEANTPDPDLCGVILLASQGEGASAMFGFEDDREAVAFLLMHAEAICQANGIPFRAVQVDLN
jgi:hypothetical protein